MRKKAVKEAAAKAKKAEQLMKDFARQNSFAIQADTRSEVLRKADAAETRRREIEATNAAVNEMRAASFGLPMSTGAYTPEQAAWLGNTAVENQFNAVMSGLGGPKAAIGLLGFEGVNNAGYVFGEKPTMGYVVDGIENLYNYLGFEGDNERKARITTTVLPILLGSREAIKGTRAYENTKALYDIYKNTTSKGHPYLLRQTDNTLTRVIGTEKSGIDDAVSSGIVRGNPAGGITTAKILNRRDLPKLRKLGAPKKLIDNYASNNLSRSDYEWIKKNAPDQ